MSRFFGRTLFLILAIVAAVSCRSREYESYTDTIQVNSVSLFYAAEGCGKPVILLHGNGGSHNTFETTTRQLAQAGYMVYAIDSRGQGANKPLDEYHYKDMAADIKEFIDVKGLVKPAIFGYSDGGIIALQLEVMYPGTLGAIITGGANIFVEGALTESFRQKHFYKENPSPLEIMMINEPEMTVEDMKGINTPCLILSGENDIILPEHTRLIGESIQGAEYEILPGEGHGTYIRNCRKIGDLILDFFSRIGY